MATSPLEVAQVLGIGGSLGASFSLIHRWLRLLVGLRDSRILSVVGDCVGVVLHGFIRVSPLPDLRGEAARLQDSPEARIRVIWVCAKPGAVRILNS